MFKQLGAVATGKPGRRIGKVAATAAVLMVTGGVAGSQNPETANPVPTVGSNVVSNPGDAVTPGVRPPINAPALATPASGKELKFVSLTPCRLFDTRVSGAGGPLATNTTRGFNTWGGLTGQGGKTGGCGVPNYARAVEMNLGAISAGGASGYLKAFAYTDPEPLASVVNYPKTGAIANMITVEMTPAAAADIKIKASSSVHVFADVAGYWVQPTFVAVAPDGTIYADVASGVVDVSHFDTGKYLVTFNQSTDGCAVSATDIIFAENRDVSADASGTGVYVYVTNSSEVFEDTYFFLTMNC